VAVPVEDGGGGRAHREQRRRDDERALRFLRVDDEAGRGGADELAGADPFFRATVHPRR
jgi:hypothetical protein